MFSGEPMPSRGNVSSHRARAPLSGHRTPMSDHRTPRSASPLPGSETPPHEDVAGSTSRELSRTRSGISEGNSLFGSHIGPEGMAHLLRSNESNCMVCSAKLGKRNMNPRHHCRLCGRSVCGNCSPSTIQLPSYGDKLQRACTPCITDSLETSQLKTRLHQIAEQLAGICDTDPPGVPQNVLEAVQHCDDAADTAEQRLTDVIESKVKADTLARQSEAKLAQETQDQRGLEEALSGYEDSLREAVSRANGQSIETIETLRHLNLRIQSLTGRSATLVRAGGTGAPRSPPTIEEALALCEASLRTVEVRMEQLQDMANEGSKRSQPTKDPQPPQPWASLPPSLPDTPASSFGGGGRLADDSRTRQGCAKGCPTQ